MHPFVILKVVNVERKTTGGFARGVLEIESGGNGDDTKHRRYIVLFQNEYLIAKQQDGDREKVRFAFYREDLVND